MANPQRNTLLRRALTIGAVAVAATVLGSGSPIASAAPAGKSPVASFTSLDNAANWAIVKQAAKTGYVVPAKYAANCGALQ